MGAQDSAVARFLTNGGRHPPGRDELEFTLIGPGYGESVILHVGNGLWVLVDSCIDAEHEPCALTYLNGIGVDPARDVCMVVASHWHDDHIRGMARLVEACRSAKFCCASALCTEEFLAVVGALENRPLTSASSGAREIHRVFSLLEKTDRFGPFAIANRRVFSQGSCEIWSLSPSDRAIGTFLKSIGNLLPATNQSKRRSRSLSPNRAAVALWIQAADTAVLLGSDVEKNGWREIASSAERPQGEASALKAPHHGSENAHEPSVWKEMLIANPVAALTPWRRGRSVLPKRSDIERLVSCTERAYATSRNRTPAALGRRRDKAVERTIRESGIQLRKAAMPNGGIRLRRPPGPKHDWTVELFGSAYRLSMP